MICFGPVDLAEVITGTGIQAELGGQGGGCGIAEFLDGDLTGALGLGESDSLGNTGLLEERILAADHGRGNAHEPRVVTRTKSDDTDRCAEISGWDGSPVLGGTPVVVETEVEVLRCGLGIVTHDKLRFYLVLFDFSRCDIAAAAG